MQLSIEKDKSTYTTRCSTPCPTCACGGTCTRCRYPSRAKVFEPKCPPPRTTIMDGFNDPPHKYAWNIQYTTGQKSALGIVRVSHNQDDNSVTWIFRSGAHARSFKTMHGPPTMVNANWNKGKVPQRQHARFLDRVKYAIADCAAHLRRLLCLHGEMLG